MKNSYSAGELHFMFFPSRRKTFIGACAELCIVEEEKDMELAKYRTFASAKSYFEMARSSHLGEHLLNQELPDEIVEEYVEFIRKTKLKDVEGKVVSVYDLQNRTEKSLASNR